MSKIPKARQRPLEIAQELKACRRPTEARRQARAIELIVSHLMVRRSPARKMPVRSRKVTPGIKREIERLAEETDLHSSQIAAQLNVNPGRVSEVLQGDV